MDDRCRALITNSFFVSHVYVITFESVSINAALSSSHFNSFIESTQSISRNAPSMSLRVVDRVHRRPDLVDNYYLRQNISSSVTDDELSTTNSITTLFNRNSGLSIFLLNK